MQPFAARRARRVPRQAPAAGRVARVDDVKRRQLMLGLPGLALAGSALTVAGGARAIGPRSEVIPIAGRIYTLTAPEYRGYVERPFLSAPSAVQELHRARLEALV